MVNQSSDELSEVNQRPDNPWRPIVMNKEYIRTVPLGLEYPRMPLPSSDHEHPPLLEKSDFHMLGLDSGSGT